MSPIRLARRHRRAPRRLIALTAIGVATAPATACAAVSTESFTTTCRMPFSGGTNIPARFTSTMPTVVPLGSNLRGASLRLELDLSGGPWDEFSIIYAASRVNGLGRGVITMQPSAGPATALPAALGMAPTTVPTEDPTVGSWVVPLIGTLASYSPTTAGLISATSTAPTLFNMTARDRDGNVIREIGNSLDSDRNQATFDVTCDPVTVPLGNLLVYQPGTSVPLAPAQPAPPVRANSTCDWPLVGAQPATIQLDATLPAAVPPDSPLPPTPVDVTYRFLGDTWSLMRVVGAGRLGGRATLVGHWTGPDGTSIPFQAPFQLADVAIPTANPGASGLTLSGRALLPTATFRQPGTASATVDALRFNGAAVDRGGLPIELGAPTDSDGAPSTFDLPCDAIGGQRLAATTVTNGAPALPTPTPTPVPTPVPTPKPAARTNVALTPTCSWPAVSPLPVRVTLNPRYPLYVRPGAAAGSWPVPVTLTYPNDAWLFAQIVAGTKLSTELRLGLRAVSPDGTSRRLQTTTRLADLTVTDTDPGSAGLQLTGTLWLPSTTFTGTGIGSILIDDVGANNVFDDPDGRPMPLGDARDSDGIATTFDMTCPPMASTRLLEVGVTPSAPNVPASPTPTPAPPLLPGGGVAVG